MLKLPPPLWALIYVALCIALSAALGWPGFFGLEIAPLGMALVVLGAALPVWAVLLFRRERTEINPTSPANRTLVTSGPFGITRNPMYLGLVIVTLGVAVWVGAWPMFLAPIALFATANGVHVPFEEAKMRRQFPAEFEAYAGRVRRWI